MDLEGFMQGLECRLKAYGDLQSVAGVSDVPIVSIVVPFLFNQFCIKDPKR